MYGRLGEGWGWVRVGKGRVGVVSYSYTMLIKFLR